MMKTKSRNLISNLLLTVVSTLITYYCCEAIYRYYKYNEIFNTVIYFNNVDAIPAYFDAKIGFKYFPDFELSVLMSHPKEKPLKLKGKIHERYVSLPDNYSVAIWDPENKWNPKKGQLFIMKNRSNNKGHISSRDDYLEKPDSEYRIGVLGDSFATCFSIEATWPDILENLLNSDSLLKQRLGVLNFKVINFAQDGTGVLQLPEVYKHEAKRYKPDLLLVNFISHDIVREFIWVNTIRKKVGDLEYLVNFRSNSLSIKLSDTAISDFSFILATDEIINDPVKKKIVLNDFFQLLLNRIPWFSPYPELLAELLGNRLGFPLSTKLFNESKKYYNYDKDDAVSNSLIALREIKENHPNVLFLHHPVLQEIIPSRDEESFLPFLYALMRKGADLHILPMIRYMPFSKDVAEIKSWYKADGHPSSYGADLYANAVYKAVKKKLSFKKPNMGSFEKNINQAIK